MSDVRAVVAAHGSLAAGFTSAVAVITGRGHVLRAVSNDGLDAAGIRDAITQALDETGARVVFTDLPGGSCTLAARRIQRERPALAVVTGVNLPLLLDFVLRDANAASDLETAAARGRESVRLSPGDSDVR